MTQKKILSRLNEVDAAYAEWRKTGRGAEDLLNRLPLLIAALRLTTEQLEIIREYDPPIVGDILAHVERALRDGTP